MDKHNMKILFVDDSSAVLDMLKKMVTGMNNDWKVQYAMGGTDAVALLDLERFDVVVTDLQMPDINGVKLLKYIQKRFPEIIRIVFSASLTKELVMEVASFTHRFILKPCGIEKLSQTIENTLFIHNDLDNKKIQKVLIKTSSIPSLPKVYNELMDRIDDEMFSLRDAATLISSDIGMSANILKQINLLGYGDEITSVNQAVILLGLNSIKAIALSAHIFSKMEPVDIPHFSFEELVRHSMLTAHFAKEITLLETNDEKMAETAFVAGVLHDLGTIILVLNFPGKYAEVLERVHTSNRPITEVERNLIGVTHGEIAGYLLALWGFRESVTSAVAFHEEPHIRNMEMFSPLSALYVSSYLACQYEGVHPCERNMLENSEYIKDLNCVDRIDVWKERCNVIYESITF